MSANEFRSKIAQALEDSQEMSDGELDELTADLHRMELIEVVNFDENGRPKWQVTDLGQAMLDSDHIQCPRCQWHFYTPQGRPLGKYDPAYPALSRTDNETYICSGCGQQEAWEQFGGMLSPQSAWPVSPGVDGQHRELPGV